MSVSVAGRKSRPASRGFDSRHIRRLWTAVIPAGVLLAAPNWYIGDGPNLLPLIEGDFASYLVRDAWGDCPTGCTGQEFWYFEVVNGSDYLGHWDPLETPEPPLWWERARRNVELYRTF